MSDQFSTLDIVKALKIPRERLRDWMSRDFIIPTEKAQGQGTKALFSREDVYAVALFQNLINKGFKRKDASHLVNDILHLDAIEIITYLIFRYDQINDKPVIHKLSIGHEMPDTSCLFDLQKATMDDEELYIHDPLYPTEDWDHIFIINWKKLRQTVDAQLLKLT